MSPGPLDQATNTIDDVNALLVQFTALIPVVGGVISTIVQLFAKRGEPLPKALAQAVGELQAEIDKVNANDAAWRAAHPD
jgi:hypothetical protein